MRERTVRCHEAHDDEFLILPHSPDKSFVLLETFDARNACTQILFIHLLYVNAWLDSPSFIPSVGW